MTTEFVPLTEFIPASIQRAVFGDNPSQVAIAQEGMTWVDVLLRKNLDYGDSVFQVGDFSPDVPCDAAIRVRMGDKTSRLRTLLKKVTSSGSLADATGHVDESVEDTVRDLGAYCLLLLVGWKLQQQKNKKVQDYDKVPEQFLKDVAVVIGSPSGSGLS